MISQFRIDATCLDFRREFIFYMFEIFSLNFFHEEVIRIAQSQSLIQEIDIWRRDGVDSAERAAWQRLRLSSGSFRKSSLPHLAAARSCGSASLPSESRMLYAALNQPSLSSITASSSAASPEPSKARRTMHSICSRVFLFLVFAFHDG